jgi:hypothetical protein
MTLRTRKAVVQILALTMRDLEAERSRLFIAAVSGSKEAERRLRRTEKRIARMWAMASVGELP